MQLAHEEARLYAAGDVKGAALIAELVALKTAASALVDLIEASVRTQTMMSRAQLTLQKRLTRNY